MKAIRRYTGRRGVILRLLFSLLAAGAALAVCSKSSFLYPLNDWVDVNCFFTVGRGMLHGLVPYRDLYEQKGTYYLYRLKENAETGSPAAHLRARMDGTHFKFILGLRE